LCFELTLGNGAAKALVMLTITKSLLGTWNIAGKFAIKIDGDGIHYSIQYRHLDGDGGGLDIGNCSVFTNSNSHCNYQP